MSVPTREAASPNPELRVAWLFGLARSGSSITAYAGAHAAGAAVADEVLGPWDRTGPPYNYPQEQAGLVDAFKASHARLTPGITDSANQLFASIVSDAKTTRIVSKHPHLRFTPDELAEHFPEHTAAYLIRNPLRRLASIHARGWTSIVRPNHDIDFFREYAERWLARPVQQQLIFEDLRRDPKTYFAKLLTAWEWQVDDAAIERAISYQRSRYHGKSGETEPENHSERTVSDQSRCTPPEAVDLYLRDPFMRDLFRRCGWSLRRGDYLPTRTQRTRAWLGSIKRRVVSVTTGPDQATPEPASNEPGS